MSEYQKIDQYQEICATTIEEIQHIVDEHKSFYQTPRHISENSEPTLQTFYRGQSNSEWAIVPSLSRTKTSESQILKTHMPEKPMSLFKTIAYIQHYYTGTRFIDFTTSPDIATFFACLDSNDTDGAVFLYNYVPHQEEWYTAIILSELARIESGDKVTVQFLAEQILENNSDLKSRFSSIEELNGGIISVLDHGFMALPNSETLNGNLRLKRQQGCFFVCGVEFDPKITSTDRWFSRAGRNQFYPHSAVVPSCLKSGNNLVKIIIPKEYKQNILWHLELKGITHSYLLPNL